MKQRLHQRTETRVCIFPGPDYLVFAFTNVVLVVALLSLLMFRFNISFCLPPRAKPTHSIAFVQRYDDVVVVPSIDIV